MVVDGFIGVILIGGFTQVFKAIAEGLGLKKDNALHDPLIWLFAVLIGIGGFIVNARLDGALTGPEFRIAVGLGYLAVTSAIGHYSLLTHDYFQSSVGSFVSGAEVKPLAPYSANYPSIWQGSPLITTSIPNEHVPATSGYVTLTNDLSNTATVPMVVAPATSTTTHFADGTSSVSSPTTG